MARSRVLILEWLPEGTLPLLRAEMPKYDFVEARTPDLLRAHVDEAVMTYGLPPVPLLTEGHRLRWLQLISAGVPQDLCPIARARGIQVTNLAGLYGPSIAEHALVLMATLARNLHVVQRNQQQRRWDRDIASSMRDLHGRTVAILGLGNIGRHIARLARLNGMRVFGCRRTDRPAPWVDRVYPRPELQAMLAEADIVAVAAPLTSQTEGMLGPAEFAAMKRGVIYVNVSRGGIAQEQALLAALDSGHVAGAGLDVYPTEPLAPEHPLWSLPQVIVSPHYSGETINRGPLPSERFARNLRAWAASARLEGIVDLEWGY